MSEITKNQLKLVRSLNQKKTRAETGLFVVEGKKNVEELINSNWDIEFVALTASANIDYSDTLEISPKDLKQVSSLKNPDGILAVAKQKQFDLDFNRDELVLALDNINDPGNLGTIIRTADWFGIKNIICSPTTVDCYNPKVVQSTKGSLFHININYFDLEEVLKKFSGEIIGAALDGEPFSLSKTNGNTILLMGSESHGISSKLESLLTKKVLIPKKGKAESLNVGIATGILLAQLT